VELYLFGSPLWLSMAMVALGEFLSVSVCGVALFKVLMKNRVLMSKLRV
jgi:uncharacterized membrane protein